MKRTLNITFTAAIAAFAMISFPMLNAEERADATVSKEAYQAAIQSFGVDARAASQAAEQSVTAVAAAKEPKAKSTKSNAIARVAADLLK